LRLAVRPVAGALRGAGNHHPGRAGPRPQRDERPGHRPEDRDAPALRRAARPRPRSQIIGGTIGGIGQALLEETVTDPGTGRIANATLGDYLIPVNADIPDVDVAFVGEPDPLTPLGAKGVGEIGLVGVAAAIAGAVYHATGRRIRALPITLDQLL
jgi:hypothetical protein